MGAETAIAGDGGRGMHTEEEVVFGGDGHGVAHEDGGINDEGGGHLAGDAINAGSAPMILTLPTPVPHPLSVLRALPALVTLLPAPWRSVLPCLGELELKRFPRLLYSLQPTARDG